MQHFDCSYVQQPKTIAMFAWLISHQPAVLFSQNKPATSNQPAVLFSQNKSAPAISHQPNEQAEYLQCPFEKQMGATVRSVGWGGWSVGWLGWLVCLEIQALLVGWWCLVCSARKVLLADRLTSLILNIKYIYFWPVASYSENLLQAR
jgi:hypothetical protein